MIAHIRLGKSRDYAWCGRYVGFHNPRPTIGEADYYEKLEMGLTATICKSCQRSVRAEERRTGKKLVPA